MLLQYISDYKLYDCQPVDLRLFQRMQISNLRVHSSCWRHSLGFACPAVMFTAMHHDLKYLIGEIIMSINTRNQTTPIQITIKI